MKDIIDFRGSQAVADRNKDQARTLRSPSQIEKLCPVFHAHCDRVTMAKAKRTEQLRHAVRIGVQFGIGHHLPGTGHNDGRFAGIGCGMNLGVHHSLHFLITVGLSLSKPGSPPNALRQALGYGGYSDWADIRCPSSWACVFRQRQPHLRGRHWWQTGCRASRSASATFRLRSIRPIRRSPASIS